MWLCLSDNSQCEDCHVRELTPAELPPGLESLLDGSVDGQDAQLRDVSPTQTPCRASSSRPTIELSFVAVPSASPLPVQSPQPNIAPLDPADPAQPKGLTLSLSPLPVPTTPTPTGDRTVPVPFGSTAAPVAPVRGDPRGVCNCACTCPADTLPVAAAPAPGVSVAPAPPVTGVTPIPAANDVAPIPPANDVAPTSPDNSVTPILTDSVSTPTLPSLPLFTLVDSAKLDATEPVSVADQSHSVVAGARMGLALTDSVLTTAPVALYMGAQSVALGIKAPAVHLLAIADRPTNFVAEAAYLAHATTQRS